MIREIVRDNLKMKLDRMRSLDEQVLERVNLLIKEPSRIIFKNPNEKVLLKDILKVLKQMKKLLEKRLKNEQN